MKPEKSPRKKAVKKVVKSSSPPATARPKPESKPKRSAKKVAKAAPKIPSILLEGDAPSAADLSGPGERYALGTKTRSDETSAADREAALPEAYGTERLFLAARDPHWLYARWDLTREQQKSYNALSSDRHLVIRIHINAVTSTPFNEVHVHPESTHWFVHVGRGGTKYVAELGYYGSGRKWVKISTSDATLTPVDTMSEDTSAQFATIPMDVPVTQLMVLVKEALRTNASLADALRQLRASGRIDLPEQVPTPSMWTAEQERALAGLVTMDSVRRVWMGSLEITELIRRQFMEELSSGAAAQFSMPTSPMGASLSSPFGGMSARKGFWFNVNAELIVYGATEPDATVTIGGRVIKLRPDGTFSYRFALPDGEFILPTVAVSADQTDGRCADLSFSRQTEYRGDVGMHPQDPALKTPHVANVT